MEAFVDEPADKDGHHKQNTHQQQGLLGYHGEHDEGLIARRGNHHRNQGAEAQQFVRIHRHGGETAHAARDDAQTCTQHDLPETVLAQPREPFSVRMDVDILDHQHHDNHQAGD